MRVAKKKKALENFVNSWTESISHACSRLASHALYGACICQLGRKICARFPVSRLVRVNLHCANAARVKSCDSCNLEAAFPVLCWPPSSEPPALSHKMSEPHKRSSHQFQAEYSSAHNPRSMFIHLLQTRSFSKIRTPHFSYQHVSTELGTDNTSWKIFWFFINNSS
jgi:hypothetical protein